MTNILAQRIAFHYRLLIKKMTLKIRTKSKTEMTSGIKKQIMLICVIVGYKITVML